MNGLLIKKIFLFICVLVNIFQGCPLTASLGVTIHFSYLEPFFGCGKGKSVGWFLCIFCTLPLCVPYGGNLNTCIFIMMMAKIALFHFAIVELESGERTRTSTKAASILNLIPTWWWSGVMLGANCSWRTFCLLEAYKTRWRKNKFWRVYFGNLRARGKVGNDFSGPMDTGCKCQCHFFPEFIF